MLLFIIKRAEGICSLKKHVFQIVCKTSCFGGIIFAPRPDGNRGVYPRLVMIRAHVNGQPIFESIDSGVKRVSWNCGVWVWAGFVLVHNGRTGD